MLRKPLTIIFITLIFSTSVFSQISRTTGMGGLTYSIIDRDQSLTPYDFGGNPAWLFMDEKDTYLRITPYLNNSWGNYQRKYDAEGNMNIGTAVVGIKTLGNLGTFGAYTSYNYENRRNYNRSIKKDSYNGESFYFTDTTAGDFRYMGPKVVLMYSWEPLKKLYAGGYISYELIDGLKKQFSYAKTIYRNTEVNIGLAYNLFENFVIGGDVKYFDSQESIEASDVNLFDVELRYFRGDRFYITKRGASTTGKISKAGVSLGSQLYWDDGNKFSIGLQTNYTPYSSKLLKPFSSSTQSFDEVEDSYSAFNLFDTQLEARYKINEDFILGTYLGYFDQNSWSKLSQKELLIWEWETKKTALGVGTTYQATPSVLLGLEFELANNSADSSKYIDRIFKNIKSMDFTIRIGTEYKLNDQIFLRAGFNYGSLQHDLIYGGNDCIVYKITGGVGLPLFNAININANVQYVSLSSGKPVNLSRNYLAGNISIELKTF